MAEKCHHSSQKMPLHAACVSACLGKLSPKRLLEAAGPGATHSLCARGPYTCRRKTAQTIHCSHPDFTTIVIGGVWILYEPVKSLAHSQSVTEVPLEHSRDVCVVPAGAAGDQGQT